MNKQKIKFLKKLLSHLEYYNNLAPFPNYDSDYIKDVKEEIMKLEDENKVDYDEEPVVACKYCKSLHIIVDDVDNSICGRCGSVNELKEFKNIHEYKKFVENE